MRVKPKKSLGQNFLVDKNVQKNLIMSYDLKPPEVVLEIGAGRGELTKLIADKVAFLFALEIDHSLYKILREDLKGYPNVQPIQQDILKFNLKKCFAKLKNKLNNKAYNKLNPVRSKAQTATAAPLVRTSNRIKVVGNIPYYITSPIIGHLLKYRKIIETVFITVQKEFARRIVATAGSKEYGSFSCFVQYYALPKIIFFIKKGSFLPRPKVDSCLLQLKIRQAPAVKVKNERLFFKIIRGAFGKRRKTLKNSLEGIYPLGKLTRYFKTYQIDCNVRPEDLTLQDFADLANI